MLPKSEFLRKYNINGDDFDATGLSWSELEEIYNDHDSTDRRDQLDQAASYLVNLLRRADKIHSLKFRIKDPEHLIEKIIRKKRKDPARNITLSTYRSEITDLIGIRALHLFKGDWLEIHKHINATWDLHGLPVANIREGDPKELVALFETNGCEINEHEYGYRSIHYLVRSQLNRDVFLAEIQVRTIFEEGWSEIDHQIRYPDLVDDPILIKYLVMFNRLAGSADEMGSFIKGLQLELASRESSYRTVLASLREKEKLLTALDKQIEQLKIHKKEKDQLQDIVENLAKRLGESVSSILSESLDDLHHKGAPSVDSADSLKGKSDTYDRAKIRDYWNERLKPGGKGMACTRSNLSKEQYNIESKKLLAYAMSEVERLFDELMTKVRTTQLKVLEVGLGYGDMSETLARECEEKGHLYFGVDCSDEVIRNVHKRLQNNKIYFEGNNIQQGWSDSLNFDDSSFGLIIWGRIGHHIPSDKVWSDSLKQLKRILEPGGYVLQFEALLDFNEEDKEQPRRHEFTQLRFKKDYETTLSPLKIISSSNLPVGDEIYTIAVWEKP